MRIGILGSGLMGGKLGTLFARAGHELVFSYSHRRQKLEELARSAGGKARAGTPGEAARDADALLLAVHWARRDDVLRQAGDVSDKVLVSCSLSMNADDTDLAVGRNSSGAEKLARTVPRAKIVSAFGTVPSEVLFGVFEARSQAPRPSLGYCGDDAEAKEVAAALIRDVGFEPVDAGPLRVARYSEPFALLIARLANEEEAGQELAYRFERSAGNWLGGPAWEALSQQGDAGSPAGRPPMGSRRRPGWRSARRPGRKRRGSVWGSPPALERRLRRLG